jgi:hypothetical protein
MRTSGLSGEGASAVETGRGACIGSEPQALKTIGTIGTRTANSARRGPKRLIS